MRKPNHATITGFFFGFAALFLFAAGTNRAFSFGVFFYTLFLLFDFVDGNIARVTDSASYYGKFLDGATDVFVESLLFFALSIGLYRSGYPVGYILAGGAVTIVSLFAYFLLNRASFANRWAAMEGHAEQLKELNPLKRAGSGFTKAANVITDIRISIFITALFTGMTALLYLFLIIAGLTWSVLLAALALRSVACQLDIKRTSRLDATGNNRTGPKR